MKIRYGIFTLALLLLLAQPALAAAAKPTQEDWAYFFPVLIAIVTGVVLVDLAFIIPIIRRIRAEKRGRRKV